MSEFLGEDSKGSNCPKVERFFFSRSAGTSLFFPGIQLLWSWTRNVSCVADVTDFCRHPPPIEHGRFLFPFSSELLVHACRSTVRSMGEGLLSVRFFRFFLFFIVPVSMIHRRKHRIRDRGTEGRLFVCGFSFECR